MRRQPIMGARRPATAQRPLAALALVAAMLAMFTMVAHAGTAAPAGGEASAPPATAASDEGSYRLGPGDVLTISVWGNPELQAEVEVRPDGNISFPVVGEVRAQGRTPGELSKELSTRMRRVLRSADVTVIVARFRTIRGHLLGAVRQPGLYPLPPGAGLADLISLGGGLVETADPTRAVLTRRGADGQVQQKTVDASPGGPPVTLQDGDTLYIPMAEPVLVLGEVQKPGAYALPGARPAGVVAALALAGGPTRRAALDSVEIRRAGAPPQRVELGRGGVLAAGAGTSDAALVRPGDTVYVPESRWPEWSQVVAVLTAVKLLSDVMGSVK